MLNIDTQYLSSTLSQLQTETKKRHPKIAEACAEALELLGTGSSINTLLSSPIILNPFILTLQLKQKIPLNILEVIYVILQTQCVYNSKGSGHSKLEGASDKDSKDGVSNKEYELEGVSDKDSEGSVSDKNTRIEGVTNNTNEQHPFNNSIYDNMDTTVNTILSSLSSNAYLTPPHNIKILQYTLLFLKYPLKIETLSLIFNTLLNITESVNQQVSITAKAMTYQFISLIPETHPCFMYTLVDYICDLLNKPKPFYYDILCTALKVVLNNTDFTLGCNNKSDNRGVTGNNTPNPSLTLDTRINSHPNPPLTPNRCINNTTDIINPISLLLINKLSNNTLEEVEILKCLEAILIILNNNYNDKKIITTLLSTVLHLSKHSSYTNATIKFFLSFPFKYSFIDNILLTLYIEVLNYLDLSVDSTYNKDYLEYCCKIRDFLFINNRCDKDSGIEDNEGVNNCTNEQHPIINNTNVQHPFDIPNNNNISLFIIFFYKYMLEVKKPIHYNYQEQISLLFNTIIEYLITNNVLIDNCMGNIHDTRLESNNSSKDNKGINCNDSDISNNTISNPSLTLDTCINNRPNPSLTLDTRINTINNFISLYTSLSPLFLHNCISLCIKHRNNIHYTIWSIIIRTITIEQETCWEYLVNTSDTFNITEIYCLFKGICYSLINNKDIVINFNDINEHLYYSDSSSEVEGVNDTGTVIKCVNDNDSIIKGVSDKNIVIKGVNNNAVTQHPVNNTISQHPVNNTLNLLRLKQLFLKNITLISNNTYLLELTLSVIYKLNSIDTLYVLVLEYYKCITYSNNEGSDIEGNVKHSNIESNNTNKDNNICSVIPLYYIYKICNKNSSNNTKEPFTKLLSLLSELIGISSYYFKDEWGVIFKILSITIKQRGLSDSNYDILRLIVDNIGFINDKGVKECIEVIRVLCYGGVGKRVDGVSYKGSVLEGVNKSTYEQRGVTDSTISQHPFREDTYNYHPFNNITDTNTLLISDTSKNIVLNCLYLLDDISFHINNTNSSLLYCYFDCLIYFLRDKRCDVMDTAVKCIYTNLRGCYSKELWIYINNRVLYTILEVSDIILRDVRNRGLLEGVNHFDIKEGLNNSNKEGVSNRGLLEGVNDYGNKEGLNNSNKESINNDSSKEGVNDSNSINNSSKEDINDSAVIRRVNTLLFIINETNTFITSTPYFYITPFIYKYIFFIQKGLTSLYNLNNKDEIAGVLIKGLECILKTVNSVKGVNHEGCDIKGVNNGRSDIKGVIESTDEQPSFNNSAYKQHGLNIYDTVTNPNNLYTLTCSIINIIGNISNEYNEEVYLNIIGVIYNIPLYVIIPVSDILLNNISNILFLDLQKDNNEGISGMNMLEGVNVRGYELGGVNNSRYEQQGVNNLYNTDNGITTLQFCILRYLEYLGINNNNFNNNRVLSYCKWLDTSNDSMCCYLMDEVSRIVTSDSYKGFLNTTNTDNTSNPTLTLDTCINNIPNPTLTLDTCINNTPDSSHVIPTVLKSITSLIYTKSIHWERGMICINRISKCITINEYKDYLDCCYKIFIEDKVKGEVSLERKRERVLIEYISVLEGVIDRIINSIGKEVGGVNSIGKEVLGVNSIGKEVLGVNSIGKEVGGVNSIGKEVGGVNSIGKEVEGVNNSNNTLNPLINITNTLHPLNNSINTLNPLDNTTNTLNPLNNTTNTLHPLNNNTNTYKLHEEVKRTFLLLNSICESEVLFRDRLSLRGIGVLFKYTNIIEVREMVCRRVSIVLREYVRCVINQCMTHKVRDMCVRVLECMESVKDKSVIECVKKDVIGCLVGMEWRVIDSVRRVLSILFNEMC